MRFAKDTVADAKCAVVETVETVKQSVDSTVQAAKDTVHDTVDWVKDAVDLRRQVQRHPWGMLAGSVGLHLLLPTLVSARFVEGSPHSLQFVGASARAKERTPGEADNVDHRQPAHA